jgi:signal transduction histidine kinase
MRRLSRLPLRVRLVAGFSAAMFVVYVASAVFVYWRVEYALDRSLRGELRRAVASLTTLMPGDETEIDRAARTAGVTWQLLDDHGRRLQAGGPLGSRRLVGVGTIADVRAANADGVTVDLGDFITGHGPAMRLRVVALPDDRFLVVGVRRDHRDEALRELLAQLAIAGLGALAVTSLVGDRLAHAALRPVERYRQRAAEIAAGATGVRLDVPPGRDDEVTRLGRTLNEMLEAQERLTEQERRFVEEASHELRTPLTLMTSRIQLARRRPRTAEELADALDELAVDTARLAELAEQLLVMGGAASTIAGSCDLASVARAVTARRNEDISVAAPEPVNARVAPQAAERMVDNIVGNALLHGALPIRVMVDEVGDEGGSRWARLLVTDRGSGMDPDTLRVATARFARAAEARSRPGAGLGLSLVEALVTAAGGELRMCFGGHHERWGRQIEVPCEHGPEMCVTVLLPST